MTQHDLSPEADSFRLSEADGAALDALMEAGLRATPGGDPRAARVAALLDLLGTPVPGEADRGARVSVVAIRARRAALAEADAEGAGLLPDDAAALDCWMDGGPAPDHLRERVGRQADLAALVRAGPAPGLDARTALIERTLRAAEEAERARAGRMKLQDAPAPSGSRFRLADLVSIAATLLIVASVAIPAMQGVTRYREQAACLSNMQVAARAFGSYAGSNADMLPMANAGFGGSWMEVGNPKRSNSANLYTLPRERFMRLDDLACPTNHQAPRGTPEPGSMDWRSMDEISYSYRIMTDGGLRMSVAVPSTTRVVVMADRSPVTLRAARNQVIFPEANTPNHDARGQHVLRLDGSAEWAKSPVIEGDNIWLPQQLETLIRQVRAELGIKGDELPASATDAFVGP